MDIGPKGFQGGVIAATGIRGGFQDQIDLALIGLGKVDEYLGLALEMIIEVTRTDAESAGDIHGRQGRNALGVEQLSRHIENSLLGAQPAVPIKCIDSSHER